jgi:hypothetical protein
MARLTVLASPQKSGGVMMTEVEVHSFRDPRFQKAMMVLRTAGYADVADRCTANEELLKAIHGILDNCNIRRRGEGDE